MAQSDCVEDVAPVKKLSEKGDRRVGQTSLFEKSAMAFS
jgi:hypothetical protein